MRWALDRSPSFGLDWPLWSILKVGGSAEGFALGGLQ